MMFWGWYTIALVVVVFWRLIIEEFISTGIVVYVWSLPWLARLSWPRVRMLAGAFILIWCLAGAVLGDLIYFLMVALSYSLLFAATFVSYSGRVEKIVIHSGTVIAGLLSVALLTLRIDEPDPHDARGYFIFLSLMTHWVVALITLGLAAAFYLYRVLLHEIRSTRKKAGNQDKSA